LTDRKAVAGVEAELGAHTIAARAKVVVNGVPNFAFTVDPRGPRV
jgi:hypothetical protein